jgi:Rieske 2Fe-2S family protein
VLLPNVFVNLLPDHVVLHTLRPLGPTRTLVTCDWLFDRSEMTKPGFDPMDAVEIFDLVNRQDFAACELVQQSMASRAYRDGGLYVPAEQALRLFNDWVLQTLGDEQHDACSEGG